MGPALIGPSATFPIIGEAAAAAEGACVVITHIAEDAGRAAALELEPAVRFIHGDLADEASVASTAEAVDWLGGLDGLVNNAGLQLAGALERFETRGWDRLMARLRKKGLSSHSSCENTATVYGPMPMSPEHGRPSRSSSHASTSGVG